MPTLLGSCCAEAALAAALRGKQLESERCTEPPEKSTEEKLKALHGKEVSYQDLRNLGIEPTGDDMKVGKIKLYRRLYCYAYTIDASA